MMNKELIIKAIQDPTVVRLIYRALAEDPGPLRRYSDETIPDSSVYYAVVVYLDQNGKLYNMAAFEDISVYLYFQGKALCSWINRRDDCIEDDTISLLLNGGGDKLLCNMRIEAKPVDGYETGPVPDAGLSLMACLNASIPADATPELAEMTRLFRGEPIIPMTELGQAILALTDEEGE